MIVLISGPMYFSSTARLFSVARSAHAERHRLILQIALAALIADRTVERMVDQQKFHHAFARFFDERRVCVDDLRAAVPVRRQVVDRHRAARDRLRRALHFDEAHAAVTGDRKALVIAEARDFGARRLAGVHQRGPVLDLDRLAVDDELLGHASRVRPTPPPRACAWPDSRRSAPRSPAGNCGSSPAPATPLHRPARKSCGPRPAS